MKADEQFLKAAEFNEMLLAALPHPVMLIRGKDKVIVAANKMAMEMGARVGGQCWREYMKSGFLSQEHSEISAKYSGLVPGELGIQCTFCRAERCLSDASAPKTIVETKDGIQEIYWVKVNDALYLHYGVDITEHFKIKEALRESGERLKFISDNIPHGGIYQVDFGEHGASRAFTYLSAGVERLHGITAAEGMRNALAIYGQVLEEDRPMLAELEAQSMAAMSTFQTEFRIRRPSGEIRWIMVTSSPRRLANNHLVWDGFEFDITERKLLEEEKEELLKKLKERIKELNCLYAISSIIEIPDIAMADKLKSMADALPPAWMDSDICCAKIVIGRDEYQTANFQETTWKQASDIMVQGTKAGFIEIGYFEERAARDEGPFLRQERILITALASRIGRFIERIKAQEALKESEHRFRELSIVDNLTQLYNSRHLFDQLKNELDRAKRYKRPVALILIDVDNFKAFNDAFGHIEGDRVLQRFGQTIKRCLRNTDSAYRYGGEEFILLLPETGIEDAVIIAERIRAEFKKEMLSIVPGKEVHMTLSLGVGQHKPQEEMKAFVHRVDQLMYLAKKNGKDRIFYEAWHQEE